MAIDKGKLQEDEEEEASAVARFYKIVLGCDYKQLTKENERKNRKELSVVKNTYKDGEEALVCKMRLVMECSEADGFHILLVTYEEDECLAPNDILLLSKEEGPPGTGKTQTILSILGAIMHAIPARVQFKYSFFTCYPLDARITFVANGYDPELIQWKARRTQ